MLFDIACSSVLGACLMDGVGNHAHEFFSPSDRLLGFFLGDYVHFFVDDSVSFLSHAVHDHEHSFACLGS